MKRNEMLIEPEELIAKQGDPNLRIYDATILFFRKEGDPTAHEQYLEKRIPNAAFFDHQTVSDASNKYMYMVLPEAELAAQISQMGISNESEVVFYTSGYLPCATRAWWVLHYAGHNNVRVLNGGLAGWEKAGGTTEQGEHTHTPATFTSQLRPTMFANKDEVLASLENGRICTVNTLNPKSYEQGHITGSSLLSCSDLMIDMSAFIPDAELATRLQEEAQHERIITYCGGGIAATSNAMAHLMAGNPNVSVYDGSMDEWKGEGLPITSNQA